MGLRKYVFNPFLGNLDTIEQDIIEVSSDPTTGIPGVLYMVTGDPTTLWYFLNGNRYYITGTIDNPSGTAFDFITGAIFDFANGSTEFDFVT